MIYSNLSEESLNLFELIDQTNRESIIDELKSQGYDLGEIEQFKQNIFILEESIGGQSPTNPKRFLEIAIYNH